MRRLAFAVKRHDQRQPHRDFRRRDRDDEENHDLPVEIAVEAGQRDQREVGRVEHQFQAHVNDEQIAPHDDAEQAEAEQAAR